MNNTKYTLKIILLAAGKSQRFDAIKILAPVKNKKTTTSLIEHVLAKLISSLAVLNIDKSCLHIATGNYHKQLAQVLEKQYSLIYCSNAHLGLGHTIAQSIELIKTGTEKPSHIMIILADQIALTSHDYIQLLKQSILTPNKLICAQAGNEIMPPAIFPHQYFTQLQNLTGDKGAKVLLHKNKNNLHKVCLPNAAIDIDTQQDLITWNKNNITN